MKKLPIGIQDFASIRNGGYYYADKTAIAHRIVSSGKMFFLSRPRRFGKSLVCSTLAAIWEGRRELFDGLAIADTDWTWQKHPVVRIDLNAANYEAGVDRLTVLLNRSITDTMEKYGCVEKFANPQDGFQLLLKTLYRVTGRPVAVIIDEYDKPLLSTIDNPQLQDQIRTELKSFYGVLKSADEFLAFAFLTGVTKFSQVSVFSDLNQLRDISLVDWSSTLCGFTQQDVEAGFADEIAKFSATKGYSPEEYLSDLRRWYNGYCFSAGTPTVYNPFGLLNHMDSGRFDPYWFSTGTPTFLIKLIQEQKIDVLGLEDFTCGPEDFVDYRKEKMAAVPVLYQAGYLTIRDFDPRRNLYQLGYPNEEVRVSFSKSLADVYTGVDPMKRTALVAGFADALEAGDVDTFLTILKSFFAGIPYDLSDRTERHYQLVFYLVFRLLGQFCETEVRTATGRADAIVTAGDYRYCFEFKLFDSAESALAQIDNKEYLLPWAAEAKRLIKVGVAMDAAQRNIGRWVVG